MKSKSKLFGIALLALMSCHGETKPIETTPDQLLNDASKMIHAKNYDSAILLLTKVFDQGTELPMELLLDSNFYALVQNPQYRPKIRKLLKAFATESHATMVRNEEPGSSIQVNGVIQDESNGKPIKNVIVELVHTDHNGLYFEEESMWNPRIFAYLRTNSNGEFGVKTIQPGRYLDDEGNDIPSHIHFTLEADGYRTFASEFTFENDSVLIANGNIDGVPIALVKNENGEKFYQVTLSIQRD